MINTDFVKVFDLKKVWDEVSEMVRYRKSTQVWDQLGYEVIDKAWWKARIQVWHKVWYD